MTTVLVTRPAHQAEPLCQLLEQHGFLAERLPLLEIKPLRLTDIDLQMLSRKPAIDWFIFISANAVNFALIGNDGKIREHCLAAKIGAVGQATANALTCAHIAVDVVPEQGFNSEALLARPEFQSLQGRRCVIIRGVGGRELLAETLRARGAQVEYLNVYERQPSATDPSRVMELLQAKTLNVITISSAEALQHLLALLPAPSEQGQLLNIPLVVISDRLRLIASTLGFKCITVSNGVSDLDVFKTIINLVSGEYSG
ncbi:MAG: uroporphyrinogen-III synthase [Methylococcales bacterium]|nr:uroporphyrinogen-III synthase [Methylococcales bacterium]